MTRPLPTKIGSIEAGMGHKRDTQSHDSEEDWDETDEDGQTRQSSSVEWEMN